MITFIQAFSTSIICVCVICSPILLLARKLRVDNKFFCSFILKILCLCYLCWVSADVCMFYLKGKTSLVWRELVLTMLFTPEDYFDFAMQHAIRHQVERTPAFSFKYQGKYRLRIVTKDDDWLTFKGEPPVVAFVLRDEKGEELKKGYLDILRQYDSMRNNILLYKELDVYGYKIHGSKVNIELSFLDGFGEIISKNPPLCVEIKHCSW